MSALPDLFQDDIVARLGGDDYFADIVIIQERSGTADTQVKKAVAGELPKASKYGAFLIVEMVDMRPDGFNRGPIEFRCKVLVRTIPKFNDVAKGTKKQAGEIAIRVDQNLHQFLRGKQCWIVEAIEPYSDDLGTVGYDVTVLWKSGVPNVDLCAGAVITPGVGNVSITTTESGAAIYYTLDDTFPAASNAAAVLYSGPVAVTSGQAVCAAVYKAGKLGSGVSRFQIP